MRHSRVSRLQQFAKDMRRVRHTSGFSPHPNESRYLATDSLSVREGCTSNIWQILPYLPPARRTEILLNAPEIRNITSNPCSCPRWDLAQPARQKPCARPPKLPEVGPCAPRITSHIFVGKQSSFRPEIGVLRCERIAKPSSPSPR